MEQNLQVPNKVKFELDILSQEFGVSVSKILEDSWRSYKYFCNEGVQRDYLLVKDDAILLVKDQLDLFALSVSSDFMTYLSTKGVIASEYALAELYAHESEDFHGIEDYTRASLAFFITIVSKFKEGYSFMHAEGSLANVFDNALLSQYKDHYQIAV